MAGGPVQGNNVAYQAETAYNTPTDSTWASQTHVRPAEDVTWPSQSRKHLKHPNKGHQMAADKSDYSTPVKIAEENVLTIPHHITRGESESTTTPISDFMVSGGCVSATSTETVVSGYASTTAFDAASIGVTEGASCLVSLDDGTSDLDNFYYPTLIADLTTDTVTPGMALPAATSNGEAIAAMTTLYPRSQCVTATDFLSFLLSTRATLSSGEDLSVECTGCGLNGVADITIKPNESPVVNFGFNVAQVNPRSDVINADSYGDDGFPAVVDGTTFRIEYGNASAAGGIARADIKLWEATISFGFTSVLIPGFGDGTANGAQGQVLQFGDPKITFTGTFSATAADGDAADMIAEMEKTSGQTNKYIGLVQPVSSLTGPPAWGFWMPNAYLDPDNLPTIDYFSDKVVKYSATYVGTSSGYDSATTNAEAGAAPWYWGIQHSTAVS